MPGPLQEFFNCLKNDIEDLTSTRTFGGNNRCGCDSSDNGKVKLMPAFPSGYHGAEEAEDEVNM